MTLTDAVADAIVAAPRHLDDICQHCAADAVLDLPEMQAIRAALRAQAERDWRERGCTPLDESLSDIHHLPPSVVAWVLAE